MLGVDLYGIVVVNAVDQQEMGKYLVVSRHYCARAKPRRFGAELSAPTAPKRGVRGSRHVVQQSKDTTRYFDEAEYWLRSWTAPVVHFFTFGRINPRQMVRVEVSKALVEASRLINVNLWWITAQTGLRIAYGLSLWLTWALK